jgi:hypothetical protein
MNSGLGRLAEKEGYKLRCHKAILSAGSGVRGAHVELGKMVKLRKRIDSTSVRGDC